MNVLAATSRNWFPHHEWIFQGVQNIFNSALPDPKRNWVPFDFNPDLLGYDGISKSHKKTLASNSFHHQSLLPFESVILSGTSFWSGGPFELLYGLLSKTHIPLYGLGLELPEKPKGLTEEELACLGRHTSVLVAKDEQTRNYFFRYDLEADVLPCPSFFAAQHLKNTQTNAGEVAIILQDQASGKHGLSEKTLKQVSKMVHSKKDFSWNCLTLTTNDFMRFSSLYPELYYAHFPQQYLDVLAKAETVVTSHPIVLNVALSLGKRCLFLGNEKEVRLENELQSGVVLAKGQDPFAEIQEAQKLNFQVDAWLSSVTNRWTNVLAPQAAQKSLHELEYPNSSPFNDVFFRREGPLASV